MDKSSKINELLRDIAGVNKTRFNFYLMEVVKVEEDLCRARIGDFEIRDIRLAAVPGGSEEGALIIPAVDSIILVADLSCGELRDLAVVGFTEIESIRIHGGKNRGIVKVESMVNWMQKVYSDLQSISRLLATTPCKAPGISLGAVFNPSAPQPAVADFENEKITH